MTKLCRNCKYFIEQYNSEPVCKNAVASVDPVWGAIKLRECHQERMDHNPCGSSGAMFELKNPLTPPPTTETIKTRGYSWFKTFWK